MSLKGAQCQSAVPVLLTGVPQEMGCNHKLGEAFFSC